MLQKRQLREERLELRLQRRRDQQRLGAAVGEHVLVSFGWSSVFDRDRHISLDRAEKATANR
jgi:hypothetical protein